MVMEITIAEMMSIALLGRGFFFRFFVNTFFIEEYMLAA